MKKQKKKYIRTRHKIVTAITYAIMRPYACIKYKAKIKRLDRAAGKRQYLVLFNHQTAFDQFFVGMLFGRPLYYVASEDLFSNGFTSKLIKYLVAPIPIKKQSGDARAVVECIRVAREGGSIALAPEGNRTFSGELVYMSSAIAPLAKKLSLPIALVKFEGGYGTHPRWSDTVRRGGMSIYVSEIIEPEKYQTLSNEELMNYIKNGLNVNEYSQNKRFKHKKKAEFLERAMYVCPYCGLSELRSCGDIISCNKCRRQVRYNEDLSLSGVGFDFPFKNTADWYRYQCDTVRALDLSPFYEREIYQDTVTLLEVIPYKQKITLNEGLTLRLYADRIELSEETADVPNALMFDDISTVAVLGRNKVNIYYGKRLFQIKADKRFNALKYVNIYYKYKGIKGGCDGEFLGL